MEKIHYFFVNENKLVAFIISEYKFALMQTLTFDNYSIAVNSIDEGLNDYDYLVRFDWREPLVTMILACVDAPLMANDYFYLYLLMLDT